MCAVQQVKPGCAVRDRVLPSLAAMKFDQAAAAAKGQKGAQARVAMAMAIHRKRTYHKDNLTHSCAQ